MPTVSVDTTVDVDVELSSFEDDEIAKYLRSNGWSVFDNNDVDDHLDEVSLTKDECYVLLNTLQDLKIGSEAWFILDKIRTWYNAR